MGAGRAGLALGGSRTQFLKKVVFYLLYYGFVDQLITFPPFGPRLQPVYDAGWYIYICNLAVAAMLAYVALLFHRWRWSVTRLSLVATVGLVLVTASLFLTGFAHDDTEKVATRAADGRVTYAAALSPTFSDDDPGQFFFFF